MTADMLWFGVDSVLMPHVIGWFSGGWGRVETEGS